MGKKKIGMSGALHVEIEHRIKSLESEDAYFREMTENLSSPTTSSDIEGGQSGTSIPTVFSAHDTFISNPSNVGIGILARMIETDPTVMSAVQFKSLMMRSKIGEYQHDNEEIQQFVQTFLKRMYGPTWDEAKEAMSSYNAYGFSISEIIWGLNKNKQKVPFKIKTYHPSTIVFEVDQFGEVTREGVIQFTLQHGQFSNPNSYMPQFQYGWSVKNPFETPEDRLLPYRMPFLNNYGLIRIPKSKVIHHINNPLLSFGSPYGKTPVRTAHLAWQLKVFFSKRMGIAGKRQASPFIWGTAPQNANGVQQVGSIDSATGKKVLSPVEQLNNVLSRRDGDDSIVTGPESLGYKIQAIASQMDLNQYLAVLNWLDVQIFRCFLLPSLVMTDGSAGSRSLGDKHFQIVDHIAGQDALQFGQTMIDQLIRPAIDANFGEQDDYGSFAQKPQSIEERERLANMFSSLSNGNWVDPKNQKTNDFVMDNLHIPKNDKSFYEMPMPNFEPIDTDEIDNDKGTDQ